MDLLLELLMSISYELLAETTKEKKVPKWVRYLILSIIILFFGLIIFIVFYLSNMAYKENLVLGVIFLTASIFLLYGIIGVIKNLKQQIKTNKEVNSKVKIKQLLIDIFCIEVCFLVIDYFFTNVYFPNSIVADIVVAIIIYAVYNKITSYINLKNRLNNSKRYDEID